jgi:hypothetical protein
VIPNLQTCSSLLLKGVAVLFFLALFSSGLLASGVDFKRDIRPIFAEHCIRCHGPNKQDNNLRLDTKELAAMGGETGGMILGGPLADNEILKRITSSDPDFRMPPKHALAPEKIATLRSWIAAGSPWPDTIEEEVPSSPDSSSHWDSPAWFSYAFVRPLWPLLLAAQIALLVLERMKRAAARGTASDLTKKLARCPRSAVLALIAILLLGQSYRASFDLKHRYDVAREQLSTPPPHQSHHVFGDPPRPFREPGPPKLGGIWYRGNDERNPALFNGGYYQTCTFRLDLIDANAQPLLHGDKLPPNGLAVRLIIERAPNATPRLFTEKIFERMTATARYRDHLPDSAAYPFQIVESGEKWETVIPISPAAYNLEQAFYVGKLSSPHYVILCRVQDLDGHIGPESDLWLGSLFLPNKFVIPQNPSLLPQEQWFSGAPLPIITEQTTQDPDLLGITDHLKDTDPPAPDR